MEIYIKFQWNHGWTNDARVDRYGSLWNGNLGKWQAYNSQKD